MEGQGTRVAVMKGLAWLAVRGEGSESVGRMAKEKALLGLEWARGLHCWGRAVHWEEVRAAFR